MQDDTCPSCSRSGPVDRIDHEPWCPHFLRGLEGDAGQMTFGDVAPPACKQVRYVPPSNTHEGPHPWTMICGPVRDDFTWCRERLERENDEPEPPAIDNSPEAVEQRRQMFAGFGWGVG